MDLSEYRHRTEEQQRIGDLLALLPSTTRSVLDAGARDGYISLRLADNALTVTALDLIEPTIEHRNVRNVQGDITRLQFPDGSFDAVLCAEVLEHIPPPQLEAACAELQRVARHHVLIGVPYRQDTRVARTTCYSCGAKNPPWGHVNSFCEKRLSRLFPRMRVERISLIGEHRQCTNSLSTLLFDLAGNPYGTYEQEEPCVRCGGKLQRPPERSLAQRLCTRIAVQLNEIQQSFKRPQPNWIHILFAHADA